MCIWCIFNIYTNSISSRLTLSSLVNFLAKSLVIIVVAVGVIWFLRFIILFWIWYIGFVPNILWLSLLRSPLLLVIDECCKIFISVLKLAQCIISKLIFLLLLPTYVFIAEFYCWCKCGDGINHKRNTMLLELALVTPKFVHK